MAFKLNFFRSKKPTPLNSESGKTIPPFQNLWIKEAEAFGLSSTQQKGLAFLIGGIRPLDENAARLSAEEQLKRQKLLGEINPDVFHYGAMNDYELKDIVAEGIRKIAPSIDEHLHSRKVNGVECNSWFRIEYQKSDVRYFQSFTDEEKSLDEMTRLYQELFQLLGESLEQSEFDITMAYGCGQHVMAMFYQTDSKGTGIAYRMFRQATPPYIRYLMDAIDFYCDNPVVLKLWPFSKVLSKFIDGINGEVLNLVWSYHNAAFYVPEIGSTEIRQEWQVPINGDFFLRIASKGMVMRFQISPAVMDSVKPQLNVFDKSLIDAELTDEDFGEHIKATMKRKYGYQLNRKMTTGEFLQYCAAYFYEAAIHSLVIKGYSNVEIDQ